MSSLSKRSKEQRFGVNRIIPYMISYRAVMPLEVRSSKHATSVGSSA